MKVKKEKIEPKTREEIEKEIDDVLSGKDKTQRGNMLRKSVLVLKAFKTKEQIRQLLIDEYVKKYGEISSGKKSIKQLKKESLEDIEKAKTTGI